ncbi:MAG: YbjQ family protein [Phycisphaerae bacterium]|nr:YbjQ family protein [Phycisphaerae bacterium]
MKILRQVGSLAFVVGLFTAIFAGLPWYVVVADNPVLPWWLRIAIFCLLGGILLVLLTLALEQRKKTSGQVSPPAESDAGVLLMNSTEIPGRRITEILGLVQGHTVFAIWLGKDLSAIVRLILGGELTEYTEMMARARATATSRMVALAGQMGADAIINVRYMTTSVVGSAAELLAYGTAVKLGE